MAQNNTTIKSKDSGDTFTANEFNSLNRAINGNAADVHLRIASALNSNLSSEDFNEKLEEASKYWVATDMSDPIDIIDRQWLITKMSSEGETLSGVGEKVSWMFPNDATIFNASCGASTPPVGGDVQVSIKKSGTVFTNRTIASGNLTAIATPFSDPIIANSGERISFDVGSITSTSGAAGLHAGLELVWATGERATGEAGLGSYVWVAPEDGMIHSAVSLVAVPPDGGPIGIDVKRNGLSILETTGIIPDSGYSTILGIPHEIDFVPRIFQAGDAISFENLSDTDSYEGGSKLRTDIKISMGILGGAGQDTVTYKTNYDNPDKVNGDIPVDWKRLTFGGSNDIIHVKIGKSVETIGSRAFEYNVDITGELLIPSNVRAINSSAFEYCTAITSLKLEEGLVTIGSNAFQRCTSLIGDLVIPNSVETIDNGAFFNCNNYDGKLILGNNLKTIKGSSFKFCNFSSIVLGNSLETIEVGAFLGNNFESITIPNSVTTIGENAFQFAKFTTIYCDTAIQSWDSLALNGLTNLSPTTMYVNDVSALGYAAGFQNFAGADLTIVEWEKYPNAIPN